ncbi:unnamed protein product [Rotaria sp. Silwood1]|nr:unnamed protein product [Rotaria sp. Silwood1]CAF5169673.1 unnamed protein product [Rotaria sp. Silwood1]
MTPFSFFQHYRAERELNSMKLMRRKLEKGQLLLRETDKGGNLYVGHVSVVEEKVAEYRTKTRTYGESSSSPIEEILSKVTCFLNALHVKKKQLS